MIYPILNFILYLTPSYLFFVKVFSEKFRIKQYVNLIFHPAIIIIGSVISLFLLAHFQVWNNQIYPLFYWFLFYITYMIFRFRHLNIGFFDSFFFVVLAVFSIAEIWEIPIIVESMMNHDLYFNLQHITLSSFKLITIPILIYYIKNKFKNFKEGLSLIFAISIIGFFCYPFSVLISTQFYWGFTFKISLGIMFINLFLELKTE